MTSIVGGTSKLVLVGAGSKPRPNSVVVIDRFTSDGEEEQSHGERVVDILQLQGFQNEEIVTVDSTPGFADFEKWLVGQLDEPEPDFFRNYVEGFALSVLGNTNRILQEVAVAKEAGQDIGVVSQSQGLSVASMTQQVLLKSPGSRLGSALARTIPQPETPQAEAEWVSGQIEDILGSSEELALQVSLHAQLVKQLSKAGVSYGVAAGNTGRLVDLLEQQGISPSKDFETNLLASTREVVVVGGLDDQGTRDRDDDRLWEGSSQFPEVDFLATHRGLRGGGGTSYALPRVMGALEKVRRRQPELDTEERVETLAAGSGRVRESSLPVVYSEFGF